MNDALIDQAFKLFNDKNYKEAVASFDKLNSDEETPSWVKSRIQKYKTIAERILSGVDSDEPSGAMVSYFINLRDYAKAGEVLGKADLSAEDKAFFQAQIHIEQGRREDAVAALKVAIGNNDNRGFAINAPCFAAYLKDDDFLFLQVHEENEAEA